MCNSTTVTFTTENVFQFQYLESHPSMSRLFGNRYQNILNRLQHSEKKCPNDLKFQINFIIFDKNYNKPLIQQAKY